MPGHGNERKLSRDEKRAVVKAYTAQGGSLQSVAKKLKMGQGVVRRTLIDEGIEFKGNYSGAGGCGRCRQPSGFHLTWCNG